MINFQTRSMHPLEKRVLLPQDLKPIDSFDDYKTRGGLQGLEKARAMSRPELIEFAKKSGLRGRGGAGFPAGIKWDTVYNDPAPKKYVVCNAAEGEPGTYKDRYMISKNPYQLIEGLLIISYAIDAVEAVIGTKAKYTIQSERLIEAIKDFENEGLVEKGFIRLVLGPEDYLLGEEKALLEVIDGRGAMPRFYPPYLVGVNYSTYETNPTVVNNAESMSHLPHILRHGIEWFHAMGTEDTHGTMIMTLSGDIKNPGLYEVELGLTLRQLLYDIGGGPKGEQPIKAVFSGVANCVITPDMFDTVMDFGTLRGAGVGLGSGGFIVYDQSNCMVNVAYLLSSFLSKESCGQCIPCNAGCQIITEHLKKLLDGTGSQEDIEAIHYECIRCTNQTRCFLPTQESKMIGSIIEKYPEEFKYRANSDTSDLREMIMPKLGFFDENTGEWTYEANYYTAKAAQ